MHTCQRPFTAHGRSAWSPCSGKAPHSGLTCTWQSRKQHKSSVLPVSIRDFITTECPVPGFDGRYKERPRDATLELPCIVLDKDVTACPGATSLYTVNRSTFDAVIEQQGQVLLVALEPGSPFPKPLAPASGSYSCLGQAVGAQRLPDGGMLRVVATDRVMAQALAGEPSALLKAQAAVLRDRWCYYVRLEAVEHLARQQAQQQQGTAGSSGDAAGAAGQESFGSEVVSALDSLQDVGAEVQQGLQALAELAAKLAEAQPEVEEQLMSAAAGGNEVQGLLRWVEDADPSTPLDTITSGSAPLSLAHLWRLSFAPFAVSGLQLLLGSEAQQLQAARRKAMERSDLGTRLEEAAALCDRLSSKLRARLALVAM